MSRRLKALADPTRAKASASFFRTGPGEHGEGDRFRGLDMPTMRREERTLEALPLSEIRKLLASPWHEDRMVALLVLVRRYAGADAEEQERIFRFYLRHARRANNWDLVDVSAPYIVGAHLGRSGISLLRRLARSSNLWERRIAVVSTAAFIRRGDLEATFDIARRLLGDPHDLIHKAAGWMLREAGKRDPDALRAFLARRATAMPRTMLRYAIERFTEPERKRWLGSRSASRSVRR